MQQVPVSADPGPSRSELLGDTNLYRAVSRFVQNRVPRPDVEDIVQATIADALAAEDAPGRPTELHRWVLGIARHKVADHFRRARRETASESLDEMPAESAPQGTQDLLRWVERELPEGGETPQTLEWMMREAGGDKLETIAAEERVPAPRVRQRVSRLRRHLRSRWLLQVGAAATLATVAALVCWWWTARPAPEIARENPALTPSAPPQDEQISRDQEAQALRRTALGQCDQQQWQNCLDGLKRAAALDPAGDHASEVERARGQAIAALAPAVKKSVGTERSVAAKPPHQSAPTTGDASRQRARAKSTGEPTKEAPKPSKRLPSKTQSFSDDSEPLYRSGK